MSQRISGKSIDINVGDLLVHVDKASLDIDDSSGVAKDGGIPNGWVAGEVASSGEMEVDAANLALLTTAAQSAGSWQELETFDLLFYAKTNGEEFKVEAFGCKLKISSLADVDKKGGEKHKTKIPFDVTSPDFVHINGVPYLPSSDTAALVKSS